MEEANIVYLGIVFLYLSIVFILLYLKNKNRKKIDKYKLFLKDINPTISFYSCDVFNANKLFWITLLELVENKKFKLVEKENQLYIVRTKTEINDMLEYQKIVYEYINNFIENKEIELKELYYLLKKDCNFVSILNSYIISLRKNTNNLIGELDRINSYKIPILVTFIYSSLVIYFVYSEMSLVANVLISLLFTYFTITLSSLLKNKIKVKKYGLIFMILLILSIVSYFTWNSNINSNYLIFHFVVGLIAYMYPLLIIINIFSINNFRTLKNTIQNDIKDQIESLKNYDDKKNPYIYYRGLKIKTKYTDTLIDKYFEILGL